MMMPCGMGERVWLLGWASKVNGYVTMPYCPQVQEIWIKGQFFDRNFPWGCNHKTKQATDDFLKTPHLRSRYEEVRKLKPQTRRNTAMTTTASDFQPTIYPSCYEEYGPDDTNAILQCVTNGLKHEMERQNSYTKGWFLLISGALVFFMQLGFASLCAGCVRRKNVSNTLLKNILDACGAGITFFVVGYAFSFGGQNPSDGYTFVGTQNFFLRGDVDLAFWFYEYACSATAVTIIAGTLAERCRMSAYAAYSIFMTGFVYPVIAHSLWSDNGFLSPFAEKKFLGVGCIDFAGSGVVHMTGGVTALVATYILGARKGRFTNSSGELLSEPKEIPGHSISLQIIGVLILWFGWYGFNGGASLILPNAVADGSVAALTATNTSLAGATGAITALLTHMYNEKKKTGTCSFNLTRTMNGTLSGLVAVTAGCGVMEPWAAALTGMIAAWVYLAASHFLVKIRIDDAVDGIPIHMFGGIFGLIAVGLFASPQRMLNAFGTDEHVGWFYSIGRASMDANLLGAQLVGTIFILGWVLCLMTPFFIFLNYLDWLRIDVLEEIAGLDASYFIAKQEDHEQLRQTIREEFKKHKKEKQAKLASDFESELRSGDRDEGVLSVASASKRSQSRQDSRQSSSESAV